jgi:hypothetical protein
MNKREIVALGIRVASLFLIFLSIRDGAGLLANAHNHDGQINPLVLSGVAVMLCFLVVAVILYKFPLTLARHLLPESSADKAGVTKITIEEAQAAAFSVTGVFILVLTVPDLIYSIVLLLQIINSYDEMFIDQAPINYFASLLSTVVQVAMGFWLLLGANRIVRLIKKMRA